VTVRVSTSRSHLNGYTRPQGVRLGWGDYDMFEHSGCRQVVSYGGRCCPDHPAGDWVFNDSGPRIFCTGDGCELPAPDETCNTFLFSPIFASLASIIHPNSQHHLLVPKREHFKCSASNQSGIMYFGVSIDAYILAKGTVCASFKA
jgi:hypothetical protein